MKITKTAAWSVGTAVLCIVLLAAAYLLLIEPQRAAAAETRAQTEDVRQQNVQLADRIDQLRVEYANLPNRKAELVDIREALPEVTRLAGLLAEISAAADAAPVVLDSLTSSEPTVVVDAAVLPAEPTEASSAAPAEAGPSDTAEPAPAAPAPPVDQAAAVPGLPVLAAIPISLTSTGEYFSVAAFLKTLQTGIDRALIIDTVSIDMVTSDGTTDAPASAVSTSITGRVFVFVDPTSLPAATATPTDVAPGTVTGGTP